MLKLFLRRVLQCIPVLVVVSIICFFIVFLAPGEPADNYRGNEMTNEQFEKIKKDQGLDKTIIIQYLRWAKNVCSGDLGYSMTKSKPVITLIADRILPTITIMLMTILISVVVSILLGLVSGYMENSIVDKIISVVTTVGISIPSVWLAMILVIVFSLKLGFFPSSGMRTSGVMSFTDLVRHSVLPIATLTFPKISSYTRYVRASVITECKQLYVQTAIAKGISTRKIIFSHILKNSVLTLITLVGMNMGSLVMGTFIVENIFGWPGLGTLAFVAINSRDFPLVMGTTMLSCMMLVCGNILADLLYCVVDPRIRS
ncbi:MAG: ABC transporter permease [Clostridioides sp.]|jgi:peptide/nickel transport system permease protein|nr:ABC transporter permease [Clostridioides sp.]